GFTSNGVYRVWLQVVGRRTGEATNLVSAPTPIEFQVEPVPVAPKGAFARWQEGNWPGISDHGVIGAASDPDRDGRANLEEYATGTDPKVADSAPAVAPSIAINLGGEMDARGLRIASLVVATASDVTPLLATAQAATGPWRRLEPVPAAVEESLESVPVRRRWTWTLAHPENAGAAFYRVEYVLGTEP
ncbi:MAG: hypothetical protein IT580_15630, partial [Verrucomicrobiales bacterium]|nr:hypothetical protein [Verrucomicrobiales bacterium]